ncbi:hypothetical protein MY1884_001918 [Beauveria asiatica]
MEVDSSLIRLREATSIINQATDDANTKARLEQTWILQDRLAFPGRHVKNQSGGGTSPAAPRTKTRA